MRRLATDPLAARCWVVERLEELCVACGLCCDGTLFDLVKLEPSDDARKLKALGLPITVSRGKSPVARFPQPCAALCGDRTCKLYANRPWQCRVFECGVYKDAKAGRTSLKAAFRLVTQARKRADKVRQLLHELGDTEKHKGLGERFHRTSERLEAGDASTEDKAKFADLSLAVHRLKLRAMEKFYTQTDPKAKG
jgi:uncharacterized protein